MALDDVYQLSVVHILNGKETSNLFYYKETAATSLTTSQVADALANDFFTVIYSSRWQPHYTSRQRLTAIWSQRIWPTPGVPIAQPFVGEEGAIGGDSCPNNACALISFIAKIRSRNYRRRVYMSGIPESRQIGAEITVVQQLAIGEFGDHLISDTLGAAADPTAEWTSCAFSKKLAAASDPDPSSLLTGRGISQAIRSQRGRNLFFWDKGV